MLVIGDIKLYNFFVDNSNFEIEKNIVIINDKKDINHIKNVLRMKVGEHFFVNNKENKECYLVSLKEYLENKILCEIIKKEESKEPNIEITIFQGITKGEKMEYIIQKGVELRSKLFLPCRDEKLCCKT